jgi:small subunit ribosomal protein S24e
MDINITKDNSNALLNRRELNVTIAFDGATPSRDDVKAKIAAILNAPLELVIVQKIENEFGKQELTGYVKIYETAERMKQIEKDYVLKRNALPGSEVEEATEE